MGIEDIALTLIEGLGAHGIAHLLDVYPDAAAIFAATGDELVHRAELRCDLAEKIVARQTFAAAEREMSYCDKHGIRPLASTDEDYPRLMRQTPDYPHVIYVMGNSGLFNNNHTISIVGTRKMTSYGRRVCSHIVEGLAQRVPRLCTVSGLAFGVDGEIHRQSLELAIPTVAVIPSPLPTFVPTQHTSLGLDIIRSGGAVVSELHSQSRPHRNMPLSRNRIIAAMSQGTLVVESALRGGSLSTAHNASGYSRSVMAVPGRIFDEASQGCNALISNNIAQSVVSAEDVIRELMWDVDGVATEARRTAELPPMSAEEESVARHMRRGEGIELQHLAQLCGQEVGSLCATLLSLEINGRVRQLPGNIYELL